MSNTTFDIKNIKSPEFLKSLDVKQLKTLCSDIRTFIIDNVSETGGHLSSNLGSVEAIVAMHYCFDSPKDKFLFDVSHQAYTHKILTGRANEFDTLRKQNGLSGFTCYEESAHDVWESGHSSTTLAAAAGFLEAKEVNSEIGEVIAFIGDGSIQNGVSFEGLNYIGSQKNQKAIIIINDNEMSISENVGRLARRFSKMRTRKSYIVFKRIIPGFLKRPLIRVQNAMRSFIYGKNVFSAMGYKYFGPIDGHDIKELIRYFKFAKTCNESIVLHVLTKKGYGYTPAMNDKTGKWHGVGKFNKETGEIYNNTKPGFISWSDCVADILEREIDNNKAIRLICPATLSGSKFNKTLELHKEQVVDVGINEELACVMAASMSRNGVIPVISIYSTFFQRCYDYVNNDIARSNNHVIFLLDRCGIVGGDGSTHQGIFDISFLTALPNMVISQPKDKEECAKLVKTAINATNPFVIRYPKEDVLNEEIDTFNVNPLEIGKWEIVNDIKEINVITYGPLVNELVDEEGFGLINARFIKPIDVDVIRKLSKTRVYVCEEVLKNGSLYSLINILNEEEKLGIDLIFVGCKDQYVSSLGSREEIKKELSIDKDSILKEINEYRKNRI